MGKTLSEKRAEAGRLGGLKGGKAKVKKGFAKMPVETLRKYARNTHKMRYGKTFDGIDYEDMDR